MKEYQSIDRVNRISFSMILFLVLIIDRQIFVQSCQFEHVEYQMKWLLKTNEEQLVDRNLFSNWFYRLFIERNIRFPWNLLGQQLDELNNRSMFIQLTWYLIISNPCLSVITLILIAIFLLWSIKSLKKNSRHKRLKNVRFYFSSKQRTRRWIFSRCLLWIFIIVLLMTSICFIWMKINLIEGMFMERKVRHYIQQTSLEWISLMKYTASRMNCLLTSIQIIDEMTMMNNSTSNHDLIFAVQRVTSFVNIFRDLGRRLSLFEKFFNMWFILRLITLIFIVIFLLICGLIFYILLQKCHGSHFPSFSYSKFTFLLPIIYSIGFLLWFTKLMILLPHVVGACSACQDLRQNQIYNSFFYGSHWFNSSFFLLKFNESIDFDQLIKQCHDDSFLSSANGWIDVKWLKKIDENSSKWSVDYCRIFFKLHRNFIDLFCHKFVLHLIHYLTGSIVAAISHFLLYLITRLIHRYLQNDQYQYNHLRISLRSQPILARNHSRRRVFDDNDFHQVENRNEYEKMIQDVWHQSTV